MNPPSAPAANLSLQRLRWWGELAFLAILVMETFWVADWYEALVRPQSGWAAALLAVLAAFVLSHALARGLAHYQVSPNRRRAWLLAWIVLVLLVSFWWIVFSAEMIPLPELGRRIADSLTRMTADFREFWNILLLLLIIYRGLTLAHAPLQLQTTQSSFQLGLLMLLTFGMLAGWSRPAQAILTTYGFLFFAIIALSTARISTLSSLRGGRLPPLHSGWLVGIMAISALVVGAAVALGWFATNVAADAIVWLYSILATAALVVAMVVLSPVIFLIYLLEPAFRALLATLANAAGVANLTGLVETVGSVLGIQPEWVAVATQLARPGLLIGTLVVVLILVLAAAVWRPWQRRLLEEAPGSSLPLRVALRFPKLFLNRLSGRLPSGGRLLAAARIRWVYAQLMDLCVRLGKPRRPSATPLEFLPQAQTLFPGEEETLTLLTQSYLRVRYGELPETYAEVQTVLLGWERVKAQGKQALRRRR